MTLAQDFRKLAELKRTRANFEKIQAQVAELREHADEADNTLSAAGAAREALQELLAELDGAGDNPLVLWADDATKRALESVLIEHLPEEGDDIGELLDEAESAVESYEEIMDDREYDADAREEAFGELCDALTNIADAIDPKGTEN